MRERGSDARISVSQRRGKNHGVREPWGEETMGEGTMGGRNYGGKELWGEGTMGNPGGEGTLGRSSGEKGILGEEPWGRSPGREGALGEKEPWGRRNSGGEGTLGEKEPWGRRNPGGEGTWWGGVISVYQHMIWLGVSFTHPKTPILNMGFFPNAWS